METTPRVLTTRGTSFNLRPAISLFPNIPQEPQDFSEKSYLGTPVYGSLTFKAISGKDLNNLDPNIKEIVSRPLVLTEVLFVINQSKNIIRTSLNGRNGTVKEYIADGDYSISVQGRIVSEFPNVYPEEQEKVLAAFLKVPQALEVANDHLSIYGITSVTANDYSVHELAGFRNQLDFRLMLWSDSEFKIEPTQNVAT